MKDARELTNGLTKAKELFEGLGVILSPKTPRTPSEEVEHLGLVWSARECGCHRAKEKRIQGDGKEHSSSRVTNNRKVFIHERSWAQRRDM